MRTIKTTNKFLLMAVAAAALSFAAPLSAWKDRDKETLVKGVDVFDSGDYAKAEEIFSGMIAGRLSSDITSSAYWYLGQCYEKTGHPDKALNTYKIAVQLYPGNIQLMISLARIYRRVELYDHALDLYNSILKQEKNNFRANIGLAQTYEALGFLSRAAERYRFALDSANVTDAGLWADYAGCLLKKRSYKEGEDAARKAVLLSDKNPEYRLVLARILYEYGNKAAGIEELEKALALAPGRNDLALRLALWNLSAGNMAKAEAVALPIYQSNGQDPLAQWTMAMIYLKTGRKQEATYLLKAASSSVSAPFIAAVSQKMLNHINCAGKECRTVFP